jgi:hypothetical protein
VEKPTAAAGKACGDCNLCCELYEIEELSKPMHTLCVHARAGSGCAIHGLHPLTCRTFRCLWLMRPELDGEWLPAIAGFVLREEGSSLYIDVDPDRKGAWRRAPYYAQIKSWSEVIRKGIGTVIVEDHGVYVVFPERELFLGRPARGALVEAGYAQGRTGLKPWARVLGAERVEAA